LRGWRPFALGLAVFVAYYAGCKVGFTLTFQSHPVSVLWPPNSILLAALILSPVRLWWVILLAAFPAHLAAQWQSDVPPLMMLCWFISNSFEALIGAAFVRRFITPPVRFDRLRNVTIFCLGALLSVFLSSFLDAGLVVLNHFGQGSYRELWRIRFASNVLAFLTITPLLLTWLGDGVRWVQRIPRRKFLEACVLFLALLAVSLVVFTALGPGADSALLYLPWPFLLWAAIRFGPRGASGATFVVAFLSIWSARHGQGPFSLGSAEKNALSWQIFLIVTSVPLLFLAAVIDERSLMGARVGRREARINLAAENANLAFWSIQFERGESWMSPNGRAIFDFAPDEPLSRELFLARVHPEDRASVNAAIDRARAEGRSFEVEYRLLRDNGELRFLIARGRYLTNQQGTANELIGVAIDVTAQTEANLKVRRQSVELAHLGRVALMGELTASLAHELNQPLTAIASNAAAGSRFLAAGLTDANMLGELLVDVAADARRAGAIIRGIHHLVRKGEAARRGVDLNETIRAVLRLLHSDLLGRGTTVEPVLAENLPQVEGDEVQLQQVVLNLFMNAIEAMQTVPLARRCIYVTSGAEMDGSVRVTVRDHGVGLPADDPNKIFAHFYSTKPNGMGMGLAIVRSIVEGHGGHLVTESVDEGAQFVIRLPGRTLKDEVREVA
jgi:PAS domain S-box-containing protein